VADAIGNAYQALTEYLQELMSGAPHQPVRLFPYYRALLETRGAERIHPADLFFPNLAVRPQLPATEPGAAPDYVALRKRFERALLPFLKSTDGTVEPAHASAMRAIVADIEQAQGNQQSRAFWWVMHGFAEAVASGQVPAEIYVKQVFARINLQLRRLSEGSSSIAERLLRDALFFIARVQQPSAMAQQIRVAYRIDGAVPADYEKKRYGQVDVAALAAANERLSQAKNMWNRISAGDPAAAGPFEQEMAGLADACSRLNSPSLSKLLRELNGIARHATRTDPADGIGLEIATSLLFVENALGNISKLPDDFATRADAMTARLLAILSGEKPPVHAEWLDDMSREAQQRQTVTVLATEMQSSLRQIEKMLDEYFADPSQHGVLAPIGPILHQIEGALAVLDQDDAMRAVRHLQATVARFAQAQTPPGREEFEQVARNVGALSFFIESLQLSADVARNRVEFDEERGVFHARLIEKKIGPAPDQTEPGPVSDQSPALPADTAHFNPILSTVEDELAYRQRQSAELAVSLAIEPDNPFLQEQLKETLENIKRDATLVDNPEAGDRARAAIDLLDRTDFSRKNEAMADIISATVPLYSAPQPLMTAPSPESEEAIDAELLDIFLMEADEVLECVRETVPQSRNEPFNQDHLTTLRRSFHTLKGSGRMVGLTAFGEAAWSIEQVLNLRLSESRAGDAELYALLDKAAEFLGAWVLDLKQNGRSDRSAAALVAAAGQVKAGGQFVFEDETPGALAQAQPDAGNDAATTNDGDALSSLPFDGVDEAMADAEAAVPAAFDIEGLPDIDEEIALALPEEGDDALSEADFASLLAAADAPASDVTSAHEESSDDAMAGMPEAEHIDLDLDLPLLAHVADVIEFPTMQSADARRDDGIKQIGSLQISVPLHNIYLAETDDLIRILAQDISEWRHEPERPVHTQAVHAAHSLAGSSATVGFDALQEIAHALEAVLQFLARRPVMLEPADFDVIEHAIERTRFMLQMFALGEMPDHESLQVELLSHLLQTLDLRANASQLAPAIAPQAAPVPNDPSMPPEEPFAAYGDAALAPEGDTFAMPETASDVPDTGVHADDIIAGDADGGQAEAGIAAQLPSHAPDPQPMRDMAPAEALEPGHGADAGIVLQDELDADLMPVFVEEGRDILPQIGALLRGWQQNPDDRQVPQGLLRLLHTIKGSARMAGAMALGQHMHEMETRIEQLMAQDAALPHAHDDLLARHDLGLQMFELLQNPDTTAAAPHVPEEDAAETTPAAAPEFEPGAPSTAMVTAATQPPAASADTVLQAPAPAAATPLVRVRADILDRMVNQAGEVSIARSKLETEVDTLRQSLSELNENVARLRDQLREIEMQAESQITSRMAQSGEREFDPLEFDRFTRLQELTRMMAESVNDVGTVQSNLNRTVDSAANDLTVQARLTRDLQQDLMRVRMVQFASISERLYRVTRQASKEVNKRVNLDIRGSAVEIDRGVLEKMVGPFEHLLRNAIAHGIEPRDVRQAAGKSEVGELLVEIRQEGNEVVIQFADDGHGLNLTKIRDKAVATGLLAAGSDKSDAEISDLIFHPGFSTASEVTELAGRGIGMDVVRSEAAALGGRVSIHSEPGKGARFTIHLPLTLAVTQVVLLSTGGKVYAVPSVLVEQVQQLKVNQLAAAYNDGAVTWQGQKVSMYYLPALLGDAEATPVAQHYSPVLILKSGGDRIAIHVDEVVGNREVVVKNIGPQLARMIGIAGATVLGSGDIVLILNPVPLAQRVAQDNVRAPRLLESDAPEQMGAIAEMASMPPGGGEAEPVQGLRRQHIVMVVDDSLTVRRVTQRLLTREGYQVVLAKDGVDALKHLQSVTPDVMLVDIEMPRMDGFDLTRNVRNDDRTRQIPIIMITSRTAAKHRNYAFELGVNEYLGKPYQEDMLLKMIGGFVNRETPVS
jgi:chemosensory pili system protein ChpA (sensor histidine kinase/response regulator)